MNMKFKYLLSIILLFALIACVGASFVPDEGTFAFREVEVYEINGINFTVPTDYEVISENATQMQFKHDKDKLKISVEDNGEVKKV